MDPPYLGPFLGLGRMELDFLCYLMGLVRVVNMGLLPSLVRNYVIQDGSTPLMTRNFMLLFDVLSTGVIT